MALSSIRTLLYPGLLAAALLLAACGGGSGGDPAQPPADPVDPVDPVTPVAPPPTGNASGLLFSPYKDIAQGMFWDTGFQLGTAVTGAQLPLVGADSLQSALPNLRAITLAFATGECGAENWAGVPGQDFADANIRLLDEADFDYVLGTGGAAGSFTCGSAAGMRAFIARYASNNLIGVDFDIERGQSQDDIRAQVNAAAAVQDDYPDLRFSFTIATLGASDGSGAGVNATGQMVIDAVLASGLRNYTINLMVMDYGAASPAVCVMTGARCDMGQSAIQAVNNLRQAWPSIPLNRIELTPMIAMNDITDEVFELQDIDEITAFAVQNGLAGLHYWSLDRDTPCASAQAEDLCNSTPDVPALGYTRRFLQALGR
jgi:hypothetical protein